MKLVNHDALVRGEALVRFAFSNGGARLDLSPSDCVGIVAAYIATRRDTDEIYDQLSKTLGPHIARKADETFRYFDGDGLWEQGPATDDICFTHKQLIKRYPLVNHLHASVF